MQQTRSPLENSAQDSTVVVRHTRPPETFETDRRSESMSRSTRSSAPYLEQAGLRATESVARIPVI